MASFSGREGVVRMILNKPDAQIDIRSVQVGRTPIFYAAMNGHFTIVSLFLSRSSDLLRSHDYDGRQPLHLASEYGQYETIEILLAQGADVNCCDRNGWTPLHFATKNGHFTTSQLIMKFGASPGQKSDDGWTPLKLALHGLHVELAQHLLTKDHDSEELIEDKGFLIDLLLCGKKTDNVMVDEFILYAKAPLLIATALSWLYKDLASKERERATDYSILSRRCERVAAKLLGIASEVEPVDKILYSTSTKGKQYLDLLVEHNMKEIVEHASVQRFLNDVWLGSLISINEWWLFLLLLGFIICPPLMAYFTFPFHRHHQYHSIPAIKFIARIGSHLYLIVLLSLVAAIPMNPIIRRQSFLPDLLELACLFWISGILVIELTRATVSMGFKDILNYLILSFSCIAIFLQIAAFYYKCRFFF